METYRMSNQCVNFYDKIKSYCDLILFAFYELKKKKFLLFTVYHH